MALEYSEYTQLLSLKCICFAECPNDKKADNVVATDIHRCNIENSRNLLHTE